MGSQQRDSRVASGDGQETCIVQEAGGSGALSTRAAHGAALAAVGDVDGLAAGKAKGAATAAPCQLSSRASALGWS